MAVGGRRVFVLGGRAPAPAPPIAARGAPAAPSAAAGACGLGERAAPAPACPDGMIAIPGGSFFMGSDDGLPFEKPAHQVTLAPVLHRRATRSPSTDYKACSDAGRCKRAGTTNEWAGITRQGAQGLRPALQHPRSRTGAAKHPINCVDWEMADKFCREQGGRLPTEAEWEFAARGPDGRKYPWGDDDPGGRRT